MITTIDNNQRKFIVQSQGWTSRDYICNISCLPKVIKEGIEPNEEYKVFEYINRKLKACSRAHLNAMFTAHNVDFQIKGFFNKRTTQPVSTLQ